MQKHCRKLDEMQKHYIEWKNTKSGTSGLNMRADTYRC